MSQIQEHQCFAVWEVAADWHELIVQPSVVHSNGQLDLPWSKQLYHYCHFCCFVLCLWSCCVWLCITEVSILGNCFKQITIQSKADHVQKCAFMLHSIWLGLLSYEIENIGNMILLVCDIGHIPRRPKMLQQCSKQLSLKCTINIKLTSRIFGCIWFSLAQQFFSFSFHLSFSLWCCTVY